MPVLHFSPGIMVLAKNDESHHRLRDMFKKRQVVKKYWVITKEVPNPTEGVIDIPMVETKVSGFFISVKATRVYANKMLG